MRSKITWIGSCVVLASVSIQLHAQRGGAAVPAVPGAPTVQAPQGARGGRGGGQGAPTQGFPAQQRVPGDPTLIARGNNLYGIHCRSCHGVDLRGGEQGGTNLLRSEVTMNDQSGELIQPVVREGQRNPGMPFMPAIDLSNDDIRAIAEYIHSILATARGQGSPPPGPPVTLNVLVGDADAGRAYFEAKCASCHSATGDLRGIGSRIANPMQLQNTWVAGGAGGRGGGNTPVTATVTLRTGEKVEGRVIRSDAFLIALGMPDGTSRSFRRDGDVPKVEIRNPREGHIKLLPGYTDKDIHDVTAYLVTLK
jgi:cytochrome c oxidase cbb3-type subunit 3